VTACQSAYGVPIAGVPTKGVLAAGVRPTMSSGSNASICVGPKLEIVTLALVAES